MARNDLEDGRRKAKKLKLHQVQRQILMCGDTKTAKCASKREMQRSWQHLKKRLKQLDLADRAGILRVRSYCLDVCRGGPIFVVLPDGVWYGQCTPKVIDKIVDQHLLGGEPVQEHILAQHCDPSS